MAGKRSSAAAPDLPEAWLDGFLRANGLTPLPQDPAGAYEARFATSLVANMHRSFLRLRAAGVDPEALGDPDELAERVAASAPLAPSPLEELTGPFYDTAGLRAWLAVSRQALLDRVKARTLLGMQTGNRTWVYPAWQFTPDRGTIPHLATLLRTLSEGSTDPWTWALWLCAPDEDLDGMTSAQWLAAGRDPQPVLAEAQRDAARWAA